MSGIEQTKGDKTLTSENRYYVKLGERTCDLVSSERFGINGEVSEQTKYMYDKAGNISEVYENGQLTVRYFYDGINRLIREDNRALGKTTTYTYDVGGNILNRTEYTFTLASVKDRIPTGEKRYKYKSTGWRDQMTEYDGQKCEYDIMGRPTTYKGISLTWSKYGTLTAYGNTAEYSYDVNGVRLSKTVGENTTKYYISGTTILRSIDNDNDIWYNYGVNGIQGITVNNTEYVFRKNVLGDVTHIYKLNTEGTLTLAAKYKYDAWGKCEVENIGEETIGNINPIRYRGYYYDEETKLYYLNARYYDPETRRFISADETKYLEPNTVNGLNLYAYCASNPVMNVDSSGQTPASFLQSAFDLLCEILYGVSKTLLKTNTQLLTKLSGMSMFILDSFGGATYNSLYLSMLDISSESFRLGKITQILGRGAKLLSKIMFVADIGLTIYNNFNNPNLSIGRKISYTVVDIGYTLSSILISTKVGTLIGSIVPGIGNIVGAVVGFVIGVGMTLATYFGNWYQNFKTSFYNFFTSTLPSVWNNFVNGWKKFWSFDWL